MAKDKQQLPGRRASHQPSIKQMVAHYASMIKERTDMTDAEKAKAVKKYEAGLKEGGVNLDE